MLLRIICRFNLDYFKKFIAYLFANFFRTEYYKSRKSYDKYSSDKIILDYYSLIR